MADGGCGHPKIVSANQSATGAEFVKEAAVNEGDLVVQRQQCESPLGLHQNGIALGRETGSKLT